MFVVVAWIVRVAHFAHVVAVEHVAARDVAAVE